MSKGRQPERPAKGFLTTLLDTLASVKVAVAIVIVTALACVAGTLIPQGAEVERYVTKHPDAVSDMAFFGKIGLTHVFASIWFLGLLCLLASSVAVCSSRRFSMILRTTGYARGRALGSMLTHISFLLILGGAVIRGVWGQKGYLEFREGQTVAMFLEDKGVRPLPFAIHLSQFEVETYNKPSPTGNEGTDQIIVSWPAKNLQAAIPVKLDVEQKFEAFTIKILRYVPDFSIDTTTREVMSRSKNPVNPAILVAVNSPSYQNHRWLFAKFPDFEIQTKDSHASGESPLKMVYQPRAPMQPREVTGPIKSFKSTLDIVDNQQIVLTKTIEVNTPLSYKGYTFYQSGYNPDDLSYTSLQVVKDPGIPVVYTGFGLMVSGLFIVFYINPWLNERRKQA